MGALSGTMFEALTDMLYNRLAPAVIDGTTDMLADNAENGLAPYIDENSEDPLL